MFLYTIAFVSVFKDQLRQVPSWLLRQGWHEELPRASQHLQQLLPRHQSRQALVPRLGADQVRVRSIGGIANSGHLSFAALRSPSLFF